MPRLLKRTLPDNVNVFKQVPDKVLSVVEYASLGFVLSRQGMSIQNKFMATVLIGVTYEMYLGGQLGNFGQSLTGDADRNILN